MLMLNNSKFTIRDSGSGTYRKIGVQSGEN